MDKKPQEILYFSHDNDQPLTVGLLVDTSMSQRDALDEEKKASEGVCGRACCRTRRTRRL